MNFPMLAFLMIWLAATLYLWARISSFLQQRKRKKSCLNCQHFEDCEKVIFLKEQGLAILITCADFEPKSKKKSDPGADPEI